MPDVQQAALWGAVLLGGLATAFALGRLGFKRTHVRDVLHVGAGVWPLGWPFWHGWAWPVAIPWVALACMVALPRLARQKAWAKRAVDAVSSAEERYSGLVLYTASVAVLTAVGVLGRPFAPAAALLALALGDGIGGAVGLAFGRHRFQVPGSKPKSLEGALAVAVFSSAGVWLAAAWFQAAPGGAAIALAGVCAALAEALSPRGTDNVVVPACVWALLTAVQGGS